ncbi:phage head closure protein [Allorhizobium undicola]|uniref:phage head closure protein n=1 Tax=Allorhizobium undicola TaxID=78527 RepID=UPI003D3348C4
MRAGKLDRRLTLLRWTETGRDAFNQPLFEWVDYATVWAQQRPNRGEERFSAQQMVGTAVLTFHIRHRFDVSVKDRVEFDGALYEVTAPPREIGRRVVLEIDCTAVAE